MSPAIITTMSAMSIRRAEIPRGSSSSSTGVSQGKGSSKVRSSLIARL
jgi:hypothetical protein